MSDGERHGVELEELIDHSAERASAKDLPDLDLWVAIFDEMVRPHPQAGSGGLAAFCIR